MSLLYSTTDDLKEKSYITENSKSHHTHCNQKVVGKQKRHNDLRST